MKRIFTLLIISFLFSCSLEKNNQVKEDPIKYKFGYDQSKYIFEEKKVKEVTHLEIFLKIKGLIILKYLGH